MADYDGVPLTIPEMADYDGVPLTKPELADCDGVSLTIPELADCDGVSLTIREMGDCDGVSLTIPELAVCDGVPRSDVCWFHVRNVEDDLSACLCLQTVPVSLSHLTWRVPRGNARHLDVFVIVSHYVGLGVSARFAS